MIEKFEKEYLIKSYECDKNGDLRILTLMNIFQDIAGTHAYKLGVGIDFCIEKGLAWIGSNYHIKISKFPQMHEKVIVRSWPSDAGKLIATREFVVINKQGEEIIKASSQWVLINAEKKRPVALADNLPPYPIVYEKVFDTNFTKIEDLEREDFNIDFRVKFDDIDLNKHVNNALYPVWATEAVEQEFRLSHSPIELEIAFKKEALYGEVVEVFTQKDDKKTTHSLRAKSDSRELAKVRVNWLENL